jgi:hypothetical protein
VLTYDWTKNGRQVNQPVKWLGLDFCGKLEASQTTKRSKESALQYLPYDDRAAEFDIAKFARHLSQGFPEPPRGLARILRSLLRIWPRKSGSKAIKVVFVFDELDKLRFSTTDSSNSLDTLLESLKVVFTSNAFSFVFIAGKEVYQRWIEDVALGDSIYESIFAYDFYVPCLWNEQEQFVHNCMADALAKPFEVHSPAWQLTQYLQYRGRGILRRMLRELNTCVAWAEDGPQIRVPTQSKGLIGVCSKLQEIVSEHFELFGGATNRVDQARRDRWRLGLYYTLDWILSTRGDEFTDSEVRTAASSLKLGLTPDRTARDDYAGRIIQTLSARGFIEPVANNLTLIDLSKASSDRYRLCEWVVLAIETSRGACYRFQYSSGTSASVQFRFRLGMGKDINRKISRGGACRQRGHGISLSVSNSGGSTLCNQDSLKQTPATRWGAEAPQRDGNSFGSASSEHRPTNRSWHR